MTVLIRFNIDNEAFRDYAGDFDPEAVAATVRQVANDITGEMDSRQDEKVLAMYHHIRDANGNTVGNWAIKEAELL